MSTTYEWSPLDEDHRAQEMEREALDALHDAEFSVVAPCRACLRPREVNENHLCSGCTSPDGDDTVLLELLNSGTDTK